MPKNTEFLINQTNEIGEIFAETYVNHINDNSQVLPYLLVADYTRQIEKFIQNGENEEYLNKILCLLNQVFVNCDKETQDIVYISFIENLSKQSQEFILNSKFNFLKNELEKYLKLIELK